MKKKKAKKTTTKKQSLTFPKNRAPKQKVPLVNNMLPGENWVGD